MRIYMVGICLTVLFYFTYAFAGDIPPVSNPECVSGCDYEDTGNDDDHDRYEPAQDNAQLEEEARVNAMNDANDKGLDCYERKDWNCAIKYFQEALEYSPYNFVLKTNLKKAKEQALKAASRPAPTVTHSGTVATGTTTAPATQTPVHQGATAPYASLKPKYTKEQELQEAKKRMGDLKWEVKKIQRHLQVYTKALRANNSQFENWQHTIDNAVNDTWQKGKEYLLSLPFEYGTYKLGALAKARIEGIDKESMRALDLMTNTTDPVTRKKYRLVRQMLAKERDIAQYELRQINNLEALKTTYDLYEWDLSRTEDYEEIMEGLSWLAGIVSQPYSHIKMSVEAYSNLMIECIAWHKINALTKSNSEYDQKVKELSFRMNTYVEETECLENCMADYKDGCVNRCKGGNSLHTPPPLPN